MNSFTEENYLKSIYMLSQQGKNITTNAIANYLNTKASSVTDMLKKLSAKKTIHYKKYQGVSLTKSGSETALKIIRKHRLWETFLVEKLNFKWDEVHDIAEQLEHIISPELTNRLEKFLDNPKFDPHGDPIPDKNGNISQQKNIAIADLNKNESGKIVGVKDSSASFLQYLENEHLVLGSKVKVLDKFDFDNSVLVNVNNKSKLTISNHVSSNLFVNKAVR
ncbi:MAG: iron-dependent repressor [Flavobacteriales bacterium]|nr:MAG: iron-dependent repressor [Flavobacteriales bacterium]